MKRIVIYMLILMLAGCSPEEHQPQQEEVAVSMALTRADDNPSARTYRVLLFNRSDGKLTPYEGTYYYDPNSSDWADNSVLQPWAVDGVTGEATGVYNESQGLYAPEGIYSLVIASPAMSITRLGSKESGFLYTRSRGAGDAVPLSISNALPVQIKGRAAVDTSKGNTLRDTLHIDQSCHISERRSMVGFEFVYGDSLTSDVTVTKISLNNLIKEAYISPINNEFFSSTAGKDLAIEGDYQLSSDELTLNKSNPSISIPTTGEAVKNGQPFVYILSQDYNKGMEAGMPVYEQPELHVEFNEAEVDILLAHDFKPLYYYIYTVTINSLYVHLDLTVLSDWESETVGSEINPPLKIDLGNFEIIQGWESDGPIKDTI